MCLSFDLCLTFLILLFQILVKLCLGNLDEECFLGLYSTRRLYCRVILILLSKFFLIAKLKIIWVINHGDSHT